MYKVEYLFGGKWNIAIEIGSVGIATAEAMRLSRAYLVRMHKDGEPYTFPGRN